MSILAQWLERINEWLAVVLAIGLAIALLYSFVGRRLVKRTRQASWRGAWGWERVMAALIAIVFLITYGFLIRTEKPIGAIGRLVVPLPLWLILIAVQWKTRYYRGRRSPRTAFLHVLVISLGWWFGGLLGLLLFALPLIFIFYVYLYQAAMVSAPTSDPENAREKRQRALILRAYAWDLQAPLYAVADHSGRRVEKRIPASPFGSLATFLGIPGLLWTRSHQVAGVISGIDFRRVDGPGVIFLRKFERPFQVVDLRNQLRVSTLDVTSQDGISYKAILFMGFCLDREDWSEDLYKQLKQMTPSLEEAKNVKRDGLVYPFSPQRVRAALSKTGVRLGSPEKTVLHWDEWVVSQVEEIARQELSRYPINMFWQIEGGVTSALEMISRSIKEQVELPLRAAGVNLFAARIVNFRFSAQAEKQVDSISQQQIELWKAFWERRREEALAQAKADADRVQQEAWAYAQSLLLTSIAEGFEQVKKLHPDLPPSAIALLFLSAIQDYTTRYRKGEENGVQSTPMPFGWRRPVSREESNQER